MEERKRGTYRERGKDREEKKRDIQKGGIIDKRKENYTKRAGKRREKETYRKKGKG